MVVYSGACWCMAVSDVDGDAESLPGSTTSSGASALLPDHLNVIRTFEHTIEEGEFYCGGELYTAQWYMLEYRRHKSRKSGIYLPSPAAKSMQHTVVMKDWSFVALDPTRTPMHLGFRAAGTLVCHPKVIESEGRDWFSSEIRGLDSNCVVRSSNKTLYRLQGPAAPERHESPSNLAHIMQPFCTSNWPANAESLIAAVSKFFLPQEVPGKTRDPNQSTLPSSGPSLRRRVSVTPARETDAVATAGSRGMWCMMVYGGVCTCAVLYGGVWWCI